MNGHDSQSDDSEPIGLAEVSSVLKKCLGTSRFVVRSFDLKPASDGLLGFMGDHLRLCVKYALDGEMKTTSMFVKSFPRDNESKASASNQYEVFKRETAVYTQIFSQFNEVEDSKTWRAKCLMALKNDLIFEDLSARGFDMLDVKVTMDLDHCLVALATLARFHAESLILEEKKSKKKKVYRLQDDFCDVLNEGTFSYNLWFKNASISALMLAERSEKYGKRSSHYEDVLKNWSERFKEGIQQNGSSDVFRNVLSHCDLWNNNMMFRHENDKPVQCIFVDFQCSRLAPPGTDLMAFMHLNLDKNSRQNLQEKLVKHYYEEMSMALSEHDININDIFPWTTFAECCHVYKKWGLVQSLIIHQFIFLKEEIVMSYLNDSDSFNKLFHEPRADLVFSALKDEPALWNRIMENIDEFIESYIITK